MSELDTASHYARHRAAAKSKNRRSAWLEDWFLLPIEPSVKNLLSLMFTLSGDIEAGRFLPLNTSGRQTRENLRQLISDVRNMSDTKALPDLEVFATGETAVAFAVHSPRFFGETSRMLLRFHEAGLDFEVSPESWRPSVGVMAILANPAAVRLSADKKAFAVR